MVHSHSDLSHDGTLKIEKLREFFMSKGFHFLCLTDHSQDVPIERFQELKARCRELSDDKFVFVPGIEYSCINEVHIMGIGIETLSRETEQNKVIEHIHANNGMAVWAHPTKTIYPTDNSWISKLDGVEIWNLASDGKFLPQAKTVKAYYRFKDVNPNIMAFFGMDFHRRERFYNVSLKIENINLNENEILDALKHGKYTNTSATISMPSHPNLSEARIFTMSVSRSILNFVRGVRNRTIGE